MAPRTPAWIHGRSKCLACFAMAVAAAMSTCKHFVAARGRLLDVSKLHADGNTRFTNGRFRKSPRKAEEGQAVLPGGMLEARLGMDQYSKFSYVPPPPVNEDPDGAADTDDEFHLVVSSDEALQWSIAIVVFGLVVGGCLAYYSASLVSTFLYEPGRACFALSWFLVVLFFTAFGWPDLGHIGNGISGGMIGALAVCTGLPIARDFSAEIVLVIFLGIVLLATLQDKRATARRLKEAERKRLEALAREERRLQLQEAMKAQVDCGWFG